MQIFLSVRLVVQIITTMPKGAIYSAVRQSIIFYVSP